MRFLFYALVALVLALSSLTARAQDAPKLRFVPICTGVDVVECIPQSDVDNQERLTLWNYASRQLYKRCSIVVLDPDEAATAENLGFQCPGVLTMGGLVAPDDDAP